MDATESVRFAATSAETRAVVGFVRLLRGAGLAVPPDSTVAAAAAVECVGWAAPGPVYWALRATLCRRPEDIQTFDVCFREWFEQVALGASAAAIESTVVVALDQPAADESDAAAGADDDDDDDDHDDDDGTGAPVLAVRFSRAETLAERDFAVYSEADHAEARAALGRLRVNAPRRRSARRGPGRPAAHARLDVRRAVRSALRSGGEAFVRPVRTPRERPRRLVLLCDVSGSMEPYARVIIRFLHTAVTAHRQVEAFALGTRLTRLTRDLTNRDPDAAIAAAAARVTDWSGGTRLGEALREFNREWGVRGMARGAVVVIVSDGWDRGDPDLVAEQMARLARVAHRIVWVNPLKASPGFAPAAAGMAAALPFVDDFVEGHSLASLEALAGIVGGIG